jgi:acylphosphatase
VPQLHAIIRGRVQGVNFRYYATIKAQQLGLTGWVRNLPDRTVETLAIGSREALEKFLEWLHHGPSTAQVTQVDVIWSEPKEALTDFEIRYDTK